MRKLLLSLAVAALLASACSASCPHARTTEVPRRPTRPSPARRYPPQPPDPPRRRPAGVTYQDPGHESVGRPGPQDEQSTFGLDIDTASYTIAQRTSTTAISPIRPASASRSGSTRSTRATRPREGRVRDRRRRRPDAVHGRGRGPAPDRPPGASRREPRPRAGLADVRDRHVRLDGAGRPARDGQGRDADPRSSGLDRDRPRLDRQLRQRRPGRARADARPTTTGAILDAIDRLHPGGSTNLEAGLRLGYELARKTHDRERHRPDRPRVRRRRQRRADRSRLDPRVDQPRRRGRHRARSVGVGMGNYNDALLEQLADQGDGFYAYINTNEEARKLFSRGPDEHAPDRRPRREGAGRLRSRERRLVPPRRLREPGDRRPGLHERRGCRRRDRGGSRRDGPLRPASPARRPVRGATWRGSPCAGPIRTGAAPADLGRDVAMSDLAGSFRAASPYFRLDAIVAQTAEVLRGSEFAGRLDLRDVADVAEPRGQQPARRPTRSTPSSTCSTISAACATDDRATRRGSVVAGRRSSLSRVGRCPWRSGTGRPFCPRRSVRLAGVRIAAAADGRARSASRRARLTTRVAGPDRRNARGPRGSPGTPCRPVRPARRRTPACGRDRPTPRAAHPAARGPPRRPRPAAARRRRRPSRRPRSR